MDWTGRFLGLKAGAGLGLAILAVLLALAPAALAGAPRALAALERDIGAAMAHAVVLRERLAAETRAAETRAAETRAAETRAAETRAAETTADAAAPEPRLARDIAGIADGGSLSSLAALRLAARAVDRRIEALRAGLVELAPERAEVMLVMRSALGSMLWTIEDLPLAMAEDPGGMPSPLVLLDRLDRSLADLAAATDAMVTLTR